MHKFTTNLDNTESPVSEQPNNKWTEFLLIATMALIVVGIVALASKAL